jgi:protein Tex
MVEGKDATFVAAASGIEHWKVRRVIAMLDEGNTVPFIARYRKERSGELDEEQILHIRDLNLEWKALDSRRQTILKSIEEQGLLSEELKRLIDAAASLHELEDIYLPYKPKRRTRAMIAREKGLEGLARLFYTNDDERLARFALQYINIEKGVANVEEALAGASDIVAEDVSEHLGLRKQMQVLFEQKGHIYAKVVSGKEEAAAKYRDYFAFESTLRRMAAHQVHALLRAENEGFVRLKITPSLEDAIQLMRRNWRGPSIALTRALEDSYKRLIQPSLENRMKLMLKDRADLEAVKIFVSNLRQLLMQSPLGQKRVLAIDPGFKSGCKLVCLDEQGKLLHNSTIFPHPPQNEKDEAARRIRQLVETYKIEAIAVGNGTAGRETESFLSRIPFKQNLVALMVDESGASVYSASSIARKEFPDYDVTVRGAISIGRRLMDPLAELVKIDPKSIGVGQYQHDVDQKLLSASLDDIVISCVNHVGVDVNTASAALLTYVAGLGPALAASIVTQRDQNGPFSSRKQLLDVPRLGPRAFEQAAGFLRIRGGDNPLDSSAVHPERYPLVARMARDLNVDESILVGNKELADRIEPTRYLDDETGLSTINDILNELRKPGRDPRRNFEAFSFDPNVRNISDLLPGMVLPGMVSNITAFGAFIDIGIKEKGLVHVSNMADHFVRNPAEIVSLHQKLLVKVLDVDMDRKRIQLSLRVH